MSKSTKDTTAVEDFIAELSTLKVSKDYLFPDIFEEDYIDFIIGDQQVKMNQVMPFLKAVVDGKLGINVTVHHIMEGIKAGRSFQTWMRDKEFSKQFDATEKYISKTIEQLTKEGHSEPVGV